ncbi:MAG: chromate transporter [Christensenellaceae bacterium]|nr:chromate transporter [Christensenellaceae bacterium]
MEKLKKLFLLFKTTFLISITANSGYAIISVIRNDFVKKYKWFTEEEMTDYIALAQSTPGPVAVNISMITGYQSEGILGALATVFGVALPPLLVMIIVTYFYNVIIGNKYVEIFMRGMQFGVCAMLLDVIIGLFVNVTKKSAAYSVIIMILSFLYIRLLDYSIFYLVITLIITAVVKSLIIKRRSVKQ